LLGNPAETSGSAGNAATASMSSFASGMSVKTWGRSSWATAHRGLGAEGHGSEEGSEGVEVARRSRRAFARKARRVGRARAIGARAAWSGRTGGAEEQGEAHNAEADAGGNASHVVGARTGVPSYDRAGECDATVILRAHFGCALRNFVSLAPLRVVAVKKISTRSARRTTHRT
jgi:hypothetical protein